MALYFTEWNLNGELAMNGFQSRPFEHPMDIIHLGSLPPALGATTLPPMGAFSTATDVSNLSRHAAMAQQAPVPLSPLLIAAGLTAAFILFMPMRAL